MQTFAQLASGDTFHFSPDATDAPVRKIVSGDKFYYRGLGGTQVPLTDTDTPVYGVKTEAEQAAEWDARLARERAEREVRADAFRMLCGKIGKALDWALVPLDTERQSSDCATAELRGPDGKAIVLSTGSYHSRDRITIYGRAPRHNMRFSGEEISVAKTKTPEQIARDITRRLLPEYKVQFDKALAEIAQADEYKGKTMNLRNTLRAAGVTFHGENTRGSFSGGSVEVSGDMARFELYGVDADKSLALVKIFG